MITEVCTKCQGHGSIRVTRTIDVSIPAGVDNDSRLRVRGEGEVGLGGSGDLYLYILVKKHEIFRRSGQDIEMHLPLNYLIAALGGEAAVPTLNGTVTMKIPAATQSGKVFRLKGKGMPDVRGGSNGDQYVQVMIQVPEKLTGEEKRILEELAVLKGISPGSSKDKDSPFEKVKKIFQ
jgi:molecular chaperone DnaJ